MPISIVIVNYNTKKLLLDCIDSIYAFHKDVLFEIIVVDNNSSDGTVEFLSRNYSLVKLIVNSENLGFGTANNIGVKAAKYEYILLLNSDTLVECDILTELERFAKLKSLNDFAGVTPQIIYPDKSLQNSYGNYPTVLFFLLNALGMTRVLPTFLKNRYAIGLLCKSENIKEVPHILGVSMFLRKDVFEEVGGFDENFFLYFEETDLCFRISQKGYRFYINPNISVVHLLSKSSPNTLFKTFHLMKSRFYYFNKNVKKGIWIIKFITVVKLFFLFIKNGNIEYLKIYNKIVKSV